VGKKDGSEYQTHKIHQNIISQAAAASDIFEITRGIYPKSGPRKRAISYTNSVFEFQEKFSVLIHDCLKVVISEGTSNVFIFCGKQPFLRAGAKSKEVSQ